MNKILIIFLEILMKLKSKKLFLPMNQILCMKKQKKYFHLVYKNNNNIAMFFIFMIFPIQKNIYNIGNYFQFFSVNIFVIITQYLKINNFEILLFNFYNIRLHKD